MGHRGNSKRSVPGVELRVEKGPFFCVHRIVAPNLFWDTGKVDEDVFAIDLDFIKQGLGEGIACVFRRLLLMYLVLFQDVFSVAID